MKKIILSHCIFFISAICFGQTGVSDNFNDNILNNGWLPNSAVYSLAETNGELNVTVNNPAAVYNTFEYDFSAINISANPVLTIRIKSAVAVTIRIDLIDAAGIFTNGKPISFAVPGNNTYATYTFNFAGKFSQTYPGPGTVDSSNISKVSIFVNPGGAAFAGKVLFDDFSLGNVSNQSAPLTTAIRLNQVGFYPRCTKQAVIINATATIFYITSPDLQDTVYTGTPGPGTKWALSNETAQLADFSSLGISGDYIMVVPGLGKSYPFKIGSKVHLNVNKSLLKAYYLQRASTPILAAYAGAYARPEGHPDNSVVVLPSAAGTNRPAGTIISTPRGWYDAGDYNKYIVNSSISTYTLLAAYEHFPTYYDSLNLNIPESNNAVPDILDETLWNLRWMLSMQDPNDGGVYNKTTNAEFDPFIMPDKATTTRYVCAKGTAATLDFAAVMAQASRIFKQYNAILPGLSDSCLSAAQYAWKWGRKNPAIAFNNPAASGSYPAVTTGGYGDGTFTDETEWAANELYITTKADSFYTAGKVSTANYGIPSWASVRTLGLISLAHNRKNLTAIADTNTIKNKLIGISTPFKNYQPTSPYRITMGTNGASDFPWGSNANAGNQAMLLIEAYRINKDINYWNAALSNIDYLLGRNATGFSWVTGSGSYSTMHPHHRISQADGITNPVPGWVAGGPQNGSTDDACATSAYVALSYNDLQPCYTTNEVAINWNAPVVYLSTAVEAINPGMTELKAVVSSSGPTNTCEGTALTLTANTGTGYTYQWRKDGKDISGATSSSYKPTLSGDYLAVITDGIYQSASTPITVTFSALPTISNAGPTQNITINSVKLKGNSPISGKGNWSLVNGAGNIVNPANDSTTVNSLATGTNTFRWSISNGTCTPSTSDVVINVSAITSVQAIDYEIRPNPFIDGTYIQINSPMTDKINFQISDLRGVVVYSSTSHSTNEPIYISKLATGMYIVRAVYAGKISIFRIVRNE